MRILEILPAVDCKHVLAMYSHNLCYVLAKNCGALPNPNNGEVTYSDTTYQSVATYSCDAGFELVGDRTRTCSAEETWTGSQPECSGRAQSFHVS